MKSLLKHPQNIKRLLLFIGDTLIIAALFAVLVAVYRFIGAQDVPRMFTRPLKTYALYPSALVYMLMLYAFGRYEDKRSERVDIFISSVSSALVAFGFMFAMAKVLGTNRVTMIYTFAFFAAASVLLHYWRKFFRRLLLRSRRRTKKRVLFIGKDCLTSEILEEISRRDYKVIGTVDIDQPTHQDQPNPLKTVGALANLTNTVEEHNPNVLVTALDAELPLWAVKQIYKYTFLGIEAYDSVFFYEILSRKVAIKQYLESDRIPYFNMDTFVRHVSRNLKRLISIIGSLFGLVMVSPLLILTAISIKLTSKGPVFFIQERTGFQEKPFNLIKFRTMIANAESGSGPQWADKNDARITKLGDILRKTRIDELPQLFNILKGDMDFIGPRPIRRHFADIIEEQMPFYSLRFTIKPGLTGWAQVNYHYGGTVEGHIDKFQYDLYYIKYASWLLDLFIFLKTVRIVCRKATH